MKTYTSYRDMAHAIANRQDFSGNSTRGMNAGTDYIVKSYETEILRITNVSVTLDNSYYSVTTSKLQNIIIDALGLNIPHKRSENSIAVELSELYRGL